MSNHDREEKGRDLKVREKKELTTETGTRSGLYFEPDVDIFEDDGALTLVADVPGASEKSVHIDLRENVLTITADVEQVDKRWQPVHGEYRVGHYTRRFQLGHKIDQEAIAAKLDRGVLTLTMPKVKSAQPRRIEIRTA